MWSVYTRPFLFCERAALAPRLWSLYLGSHVWICNIKKTHGLCTLYNCPVRSETIPIVGWNFLLSHCFFRNTLSCGLSVCFLTWKVWQQCTGIISASGYDDSRYQSDIWKCRTFSQNNGTFLSVGEIFLGWIDYIMYTYNMCLPLSKKIFPRACILWRGGGWFWKVAPWIN